MSAASSPSNLSNNLADSSPQEAKTLILASTSKYRKELLGRLGLPFQTVSPEVDETPLPKETPELIAIRLAQAKEIGRAHV